MSEIVLAQPAATSSPANRLADCSPTQQIEQRNLNAANALLDDAAEHESPRIVLTWTLAGCANELHRRAVPSEKR